MGPRDRSRIEQLVREQRSITSDTALRAKVFGITAEVWMNLKAQHVLSRDAITRGEALEHEALRPKGDDRVQG